MEKNRLFRRAASILLTVCMTVTMMPFFGEGMQSGHADAASVATSDYENWSDWSYTAYSGSDSRQVETRYRYRDKVYAYNGNDTLSGYTKESTEYYNFGNSTWQSGSYTKYGGYRVTAPSTGTDTNANYKQVNSYVTTTAQWSHAYVTNNKDWYWKNTGGKSRSGQTTSNRLIVYSSKSLSASGYAKDSSDSSYKLPKTISTSNPGKLGTIYLMYYSPTGNVDSYTSGAANTWLWVNSTATRTLYRETNVRTRNKFWKWGDWTDWTGNSVSASGTREVEVQYRYRDKHQWNSYYTTDKAATCTESGSESIHCAVCGEIQSGSQRSTGLAEHNWSSSFTVDKQPTCTEAGSKSKHCLNCSATTEVTSIPATGHSWGSWATVKEATTTAEGLKERTCENCGSTQQLEIPKIESGDGAHTHTWNSYYTVDVQPTCTTTGVESIHCSTCGAIKEGSIRSTGLGEHKWNSGYTTDVKATCNREGRESIHCSVCNAIKEGSSKSTGYGAHVWNSNYTTDVKSTCTSAGVESIHCSVCDSIKSGSQRNLPLASHNWNSEPTVDKRATCTDAGIQSIHCRTCGTIKNDTVTTIAAKGHEWGPEYEIVPATTTSSGINGQNCINCGFHRDIETAPLEEPEPKAPVNISKATIANIETQTYTASKIMPVPEVLYKGTELKYGTDFTVSYANNINPGSKATVTIRGKGKYTGTKTKTFRIVLKGIQINRLQPGKKMITATWNMLDPVYWSSITGIEVQCCLRKDFKKKVIKGRTTNKSQVWAKIKKLKKKKNYYVRIRTYKKSGKNTYYSAWSKVKSIKVK